MFCLASRPFPENRYRFLDYRAHESMLNYIVGGRRGLAEPKRHSRLMSDGKCYSDRYRSLNRHI